MLGKHQLLHQSHHNQLQAVGHHGIGGRRESPYLREQIGRPFNRTRQELHEQEHIKQEIHQIPFRFFFLPIDFRQVADGLKGVERHAQWENNAGVSGQLMGITETNSAKDEAGDTAPVNQAEASFFFAGPFNPYRRTVGEKIYHQCRDKKYRIEVADENTTCRKQNPLPPFLTDQMV